LKAELLSYTPLEAVEKNFPGLPWRGYLPHLSYTFAVEKISRACSHQLVRHRVASFSQQSQRYITVKNLGKKVVKPPTIGENKDCISETG
jgi:thymidylate synthase (FAD)